MGSYLDGGLEAFGLVLFLGLEFDGVEEES